MKLVAVSAFRNTNPGRIKVEGALHANHVHKGARLSIGGDLPLEKLSQEDRDLVVLLNIANRIVEPSQTEAVAAIDAEAKAEAEAQKRRG